jgi:glycerol-3-phosphate dehydrogenase (NAD(P)+)
MIGIIGAGAFGTALAVALTKGGREVRLWARDPAQVVAMRKSRRNAALPGVELPEGLTFHSDMADVAGGAALLLAVPMQSLGAVLDAWPLIDTSQPLVACCKGVDLATLRGPVALILARRPGAMAAILTGPSFAADIAKGLPTALTLATTGDGAGLQDLLSTPTLRIYRTDDVRGAELGGALKNVIAIAAGTSDGLGFGDNSKAALVTRAIVEIRRLGVACGAQPETFTGLSGLGDLMVTCFSKHSRNRGFGERVGRGEKPADIAASMLAVAEGYPTARSAYQLARKHGVTTPVIDEVYAMLYEGKNVAQAVRDLMSRGLKPE